MVRLLVGRPAILIENGRIFKVNTLFTEDFPKLSRQIPNLSKDKLLHQAKVIACKVLHNLKKQVKGMNPVVTPIIRNVGWNSRLSFLWNGVLNNPRIPGDTTKIYEKN